MRQNGQFRAAGCPSTQPPPPQAAPCETRLQLLAGTCHQIGHLELLPSSSMNVGKSEPPSTLLHKNVFLQQHPRTLLTKGRLFNLPILPTLTLYQIRPREEHHQIFSTSWRISHYIQVEQHAVSTSRLTYETVIKRLYSPEKPAGNREDAHPNVLPI